MIRSQVFAVRDCTVVDGGMLQGYLREFEGKVGYLGVRRRPSDKVTHLCMLRAQESGDPSLPPTPRRPDSGWDSASIPAQNPVQADVDDARLHVPELALADLDPTAGSAAGEKDTSMNKNRVQEDGYVDTLKREFG